MMTPYVYGARLGVSIIDLNKTLDRFREALNVTAHVAYRGGIVLFVSNHKEVHKLLFSQLCSDTFICIISDSANGREDGYGVW